MRPRGRNMVWKTKFTFSHFRKREINSWKRDVAKQMHLIHWSSVSVSSSKRLLLWCIQDLMPSRETSALILEKQLLLLINLGRVISPFPNNLKSIIPQYERLFKWKIFKIVSNLPKSGRLSKRIPRSDRVLLRDTVKKTTQEQHPKPVGLDHFWNNVLWTH